MAVLDPKATPNSTYHVNIHASDFDLLFCGTQKCSPSHGFGPFVRSCLLMVFVHNGKGIFRTQSKTYHLGAGSTFFLFPGEVTYYEADAVDPWEYSWIAFNYQLGLYNIEQLLLTSSISAYRPVHIIRYYNEIDLLYRQIITFCQQKRTFSNIKAVSLFWDIIYQYSVTANQMDNSLIISSLSDHVSLAIEYIKAYYHKDISVTMVADHVGISREYLCTLFKRQYGTSPVRFISDYRMQQASILLLSTAYSIEKISELVGFSDYNYFSTKFHAFFGISPSKYRKNGDGFYVVT